MHGGDIIANVLKAQGVKFIFTLCGGHISPILTGCKHIGIRVIDVRHEVTAVFAADAVSRLSGVPGVAAVTAGPGATNTITAVKNAQLAQSPLILLGGATATALKGRGSLQDIDQMSLFKSQVKWCRSVKRVRQLAPTLVEAFRISQSGVPGPVFVECPIDLLYEETLVREWYGVKSTEGKSLADRALKLYLKHHVNRLFAGANHEKTTQPQKASWPLPTHAQIRKVTKSLQKAEKPVLLIGSQAVPDARNVDSLASAVNNLGFPVYLSGMARGLLGKGHRLQMRHKRKQALRESDLVILAGVPCDFRLDYGRHIPRRARLVSINRSQKDLRLNRRPNIALLSDPGQFLIDLSRAASPGEKRQNWLATLRQRDHEREQEITEQAAQKTDLINPLYLCQHIEQALDQNSILIADGGDFVATASYIVTPGAPLCWLDPGVFGTLGVGAGFALGAKLCRPDAEVWALFGDGSVGYSLAEFDTFVRHQIPILAVVGNDASWAQIAREQIEILQDDVATTLRHADYHRVAEAFGAKGFVLKEPAEINTVLKAAKQQVAQGTAVLVNAHIGKTEFRKGSISM